MNFRKYNWWMVSALTLIPLVGIFGTGLYVWKYNIVWQEPVLLLTGWWVAGMGITFGYHRLFAHRSFKAHPVVQFVAILLGSIALQNSVLKWSSDHRRHHRKLDTDEDPYSITKGFWHAHIGWILEAKESRIDGVKDLQANPLVMFQHRHYYKIAIFGAFILPMLIGLFYGRPIGGLLWGGFLRVTMVHHFTFFINSLCHYIGKRPFEPDSSARDSWLVAFFTFGEGYHNFHHKFQWDYRNGISWYAFDPGKWSIKALSWVGLTKEIRRVSEYNILQARLEGMKQSVQKHYPQIPDELKLKYQQKVDQLQDKAKQISQSWRELEMEIKKLKEEKLYDRFQLAVLKHKRKLYRAQFASLLNGFAIINTGIQNGVSI